MNLNNNTKFWLRKPTEGYVSKHVKTSAMVRFDMGECNFIPDLHVSKIISQVSWDLNTYSDPSCRELRQAIADMHSIPVNKVTVGAGSDELIEIIPRVVLDPQDNVIVVTPTFFRFIESSIRNHAKINIIKTRVANNFIFDKQVWQEIIKKANANKVKLIWLCRPNNPTGQLISHFFIHQIVKNTKSLVVIDEAFIGFINPCNSNQSLRLVDKFSNTIILRSLSKAHGLAGLRVGWGIGNPKIIEVLEKWRLPFTIPSLSQKIAIRVIQNNTWLTEVKKSVTAEKKFVEGRISRLPNFQLITDSKTNILLLRHKTKDLFKELLSQNILVADFRYAPGIENFGFVRITIRQNRDNKLLLKALEIIN